MRHRLLIVFLCSSLVTLKVAGQESQLPSAAAHRLVGAVVEYVVKDGDAMRSIAARFGIDAGTLARENGLRTDHKLVPGQALRIDNRHIVPAALDAVELVVNVPQRMLFYRGADGARVGYPVAVGRPDWPTPTGPFTVSVLSGIQPGKSRNRSWKRAAGRGAFNRRSSPLVRTIRSATSGLV